MGWRTDLAKWRPDTHLVIGLAERILVDHFGHDAAAAERTLTRYFEIKKKWIDQSYVHHEDPWGIATEAQYLVHVGETAGPIFVWRRDNDLLSPPEAVGAFLREHMREYWDRAFRR
jgi:hypothetical protein